VLSSSKNEAKQEARFAARLDVLMERVDTLATTVATTASAIAKKDGEIAALRREVEARDQTLQALVAQVRQAPQASAGGGSVDANELRSLKNAVAALTKERASGSGSAAQIAGLTTTVHSLAQRVEELSAMLATLRSQVEALGGLRAGVDEEALDRRFAGADDAVRTLSQRLDTLAENVESAATSMGDKEHELAALHRHFTESSTRFETIVDDIREALHAFPELGSTSVDELAAQLERFEATTRKATESTVRAAAELSGRIDVIDRRVATVAEEVSRAKTLWPVALRSLEARLDDAVRARKVGPSSEQEAEPHGEPSDDLLAGLRDSLQAMETVAAEMARASDTLGGSADDASSEEGSADELHADEEAAPEQPERPEPAAAAAGATIVPLRTGEH
jgi:chromosome segregation ATPase